MEVAGFSKLSPGTLELFTWLNELHTERQSFCNQHREKVKSLKVTSAFIKSVTVESNEIDHWQQFVCISVVHKIVLQILTSVV